MDWKFSAATGGFYPADSLDDYPNLPVDLVDVSAEQYDALQLSQIRGGLRIVPDGNGFPVAREKLPPTQAELKQSRDVLLQFAALRIAPLQDAIDIGDARGAEEAQLLAWKKYRVALSRLDLTASPVVWPEAPT
jgi:hypothetical protein